MTSVYSNFQLHIVRCPDEHFELSRAVIDFVPINRGRVPFPAKKLRCWGIMILWDCGESTRRQMAHHNWFKLRQLYEQQEVASFRKDVDYRDVSFALF
jgi:hypothetical protein